MKKLLAYFQDAYNELVHKVSWPTKSDLARNTVLVMVVFIVASLVIWLVDLGIDAVMHVIYGLAS
jgi:preprotein translocase subunit SecE